MGQRLARMGPHALEKAVSTNLKILLYTRQTCPPNTFSWPQSRQKFNNIDETYAIRYRDVSRVTDMLEISYISYWIFISSNIPMSSKSRRNRRVYRDLSCRLIVRSIAIDRDFDKNRCLIAI